MEQHLNSNGTLQITNPHFLTYKNNLLTIDVLGGVDLSSFEHLVCTLRINFGNYPPFRTTIDLYNDNQTEKLQRTLCDKWNIKLIDASKTFYELTNLLENLRLENLKSLPKQAQNQPLDKKKAIEFLKSDNLYENLTKSLNNIGILGEDENAFILFLALASHKFNNPFSVICLAKSGIGKSYILQKLAECLPFGSFSFHTKISANALYYFESQNINNKALLIEDLEWTTQMLQPLATLQTQGKLINTRTTKDKDGMFHSTTFEVVAQLCLVACAYSDKNFEEMSLPFLCLHLNHSTNQDILIMEYQKKCKAKEFNVQNIALIQNQLKDVILTLKNVNIINPYATLINLPQDIACPRKSFLLLLNFIEIITYFYQFQREEHIDQETGEVFVKTHPADIELAFKLLKNNLFRRADELTSSTRGFYNWLTEYLNQAKTTEFKALDIRQTKAIHPRTLNRYLQELKLFNYLKIAGGNKHRDGFIYKLTHFGNQKDIQNRIEQELQTTLENIWKTYNNEKGITSQNIDNKEVKSENNTEKLEKASEINLKIETENQNITVYGSGQTFDIICKKTNNDCQINFSVRDVVEWTNGNIRTAREHLRQLTKKGFLNRQLFNNQHFIYNLSEASQPVSQNPTTNPQTQQE